MRNSLLARLGYWLYRLLVSTWRIELDEDDAFLRDVANRTPFIVAHWHGNELALIHMVGPYRIATLASQSRDGEIMNKILLLLGAATSRGSSSRGGMAGLRGLIRMCRQHGYNVSFAVDGPKGPLHQVKPGVFEFSRLMQAPIYAAHVTASRAWHLEKSWNRALIPKPFARVTIRFRKAFDPIPKASDPHDPQLAAHLSPLL